MGSVIDQALLDAAIRKGLALYDPLTPDAVGVLSFRTEQDYAMGRPSNASVRLATDGKQVTRVQIRGKAVRVGKGKPWT